MTTVEKLLVQIFERKNSIIEQVKQQTELYSQHLASKLLIGGITPPSWLLNPNTSDSEELNKEELISKLLRPYPQQSAHCSFADYPGYNNLVITGGIEGFSDRFFVENPAFSEGLNGQDDPTVPALSSNDHAVCALNCAPEPDASVTLPEDQTDERILDIYTAPDQSLVGIQRSKSRQKALELRSSAKALAKSSLRRENISHAVSSQVRFSLSAADHADQNDELLQVAEPCVIGSQRCEDSDLDEVDHIDRERGMEACSDRITRSRSYTEVPISVKVSSTVGCSLEDCKENTFSHVAKARRTGSEPISRPDNSDNYVDNLPKSAGPSTISCQSCGDRRVHDCQSCGDRRVHDADFLSKDKEKTVYTGELTRSEISSKLQSCGCDSKADRSDNYQGMDIAMVDSGDDLPPKCVDASLVKGNLSNVRNEGCDARESISGDFKRHKERDTFPSQSSIQRNACADEIFDLEVCSLSAKVDGGILAPLSPVSARQVNDSHDVLGLVKPSVGLFRRVTRSQTRSNDKETDQPVARNENPSFKGTRSKSDCKQKSTEELQNTSIGQSAPACYGTQNILHDDKSSSLVMVGELVLCDRDDQSFSSSATYNAQQRRGLDSQAAPTTIYSSAFMELKQLDCAEIEEHNMKAFTSKSGERRLDKSPEKMSCSLSVPDVSLDKGICGGANQLSFGKQSPSKREKTHRDSFESDIQENPGTLAENYGPFINNTMLKASEDNTEAGLNCNISQVHPEADNMLSEMVDIPDVQIHPVKLHVERGCDSLPVRHMEEVGWSGEEKDKSQLVLSAPESKNLRVSHCHSSAKEPRAESHDCLIKKVEMTNRIALDEIKEFPAQQSQILSCLEGEVCIQQGDSSFGDNALGSHSTVRLSGENSSLERRCRHTSMESWPQLKRRKIEHQQAHSFTTSPSFQVKKPRSIQRGPANTYLKTMEINVDTSNKSTDVGIYQEMNSNLMERIESTLLSQHVEVGSFYKEKNGHKNSSSDINSEQLGTTPVSSLTMKGSRRSQGCFVEEIRISHSSSIHSDARMSGDEQCSEQLCNIEKNADNLNLENLKLTTTLLEEMQSRQWGGGLNTQHSALSPSNKDPQVTDVDQSISGEPKNHEQLYNIEKNVDNLNSGKLELSDPSLEGIRSPKLEGGFNTQHSVLSPNNEDQPTDVDQSMPVFEGFIVDAQADSGKLNFAADGFDFDELNLPRTALERASVLAEICKSASLDRAPCQFSAAFEFQGTQNLCRSAPLGGHLEHLGVGDAFRLSSDIGKHLQSGSCSSDDYKDVLDGLSCSVSLAYSGARYGWNSRNQHASPVGKLWDRLSSHTQSSEKRLSSNPELTCFPIEEDPSFSEENKTVDENAGDAQEEVDSSLANHCDKRQPLKDLTNLGLHMSISAEEKTSSVDSVDFVNKKFSVTGTQEKVHWGPKYQYRTKSEISEKQTSSNGAAGGRKKQPSSTGANGIKKAKESMKNSISKPIVSNKTSLKGQAPKLSLKEPRRNNIVSNVSSFVPLIQQKQAATACAGKRDVKVKALEAAEAAKRLEEKKENERKMRKEALKLERAKLEEKNLRNMVLEKKKKEEERKKKDADIIAKKRLREEEERKEKEKKRMRLEARQRQREQEEKKRVEKAEKENQRSKDEQMNSKKESHNEPTTQQNRETIRGDGVALQKAETKLNLTGVLMNYEDCGTSGLSCEAGKAMHTVDKSPRNEDLIAQNSKGKSYEISPYQCSDDEDEEENELPTKKYIPSWASKSSVALFLPLQQELDPEVIFPPDSFCSMDEVLLPRKLQQNQAAA